MSLSFILSNIIIISHLQSSWLLISKGLHNKSCAFLGHLVILLGAVVSCLNIGISWGHLLCLVLILLEIPPMQKPIHTNGHLFNVVIHMYLLWAVIDLKCHEFQPYKGRIPSNQTIIARDTFKFLMITYFQWTKTLIKAASMRALANLFLVAISAWVSMKLSTTTIVRLGVWTSIVGVLLLNLSRFQCIWGLAKYNYWLVSHASL